MNTPMRDVSGMTAVSTQLQSGVVNTMAGTTAVLFYNPLRNIANCLINGQPFPSTFRGFNAGLVPNMVTGHQLALMGWTETWLRRYVSDDHKRVLTPFEISAVAVASGVPTALTVTPCEIVALQHGKKGNTDTVATLARRLFQSRDPMCIWRGFVPTLFRQMGVSFGMFGFPFFLKRKVEPYVEQEWLDQNRKGWNAACGFIGGLVGSVLTHAADVTRVRMQTEPEKFPNARAALLSVFEKGTFSRTTKILFARMGIVGVASLIMLQGRESYTTFYKSCFDGKEGK